MGKKENDNFVTYNGLAKLKDPREERFAHAYALILRVKEASLKAGYEEKRGYVLLKKPDVKARIKYLTAIQLTELDVTRERVLREQARIAFADPGQMLDEDGDLLPLHEMPEDIRRAISGMDYELVRDKNGNIDGKTIKPRMHSKSKALNDLMRNLGLFEKDNRQQSGGVNDFIDELRAIAAKNGSTAINNA